MGKYLLLKTSDGLASIAQEHVERWLLCSEFKSLEDFLDTHTEAALDNLIVGADRAGYLAYTYSGATFHFPEFCRGDALYAFADYLSSLLNENGYMDASKYLDALLEI